MRFFFYQGDTESRGRHSALTLACILLLGFCPVLQAQTKNSGSGQTASTLEGVLTQMDAAAARFRSAQADFSWDQYQKVVNETDTQKGTVYYRRTGKGE